MTTQELSSRIAALGGHALPEANGHLRVVACHSSEDKSQMIGFALVVARVLQVSQSHPLRGHSLSQSNGVTAYTHGTGHGGTNLHTILLAILGAVLFSRVTSYGVSNLMPQYNCQRGFVLSYRQQTFENADKSTRHTPSIDILVLHQVKLPLIILNILSHAIVAKIALNSCRQSLTYPLYHSGIGSIGGRLSRLHIVTILLAGETQHFAVTHHQILLAPCYWHSLGGATANKHNGHQRQ